MGCAHNHQLEVDFPTHDALTCRGYIAWDAVHVDHVFLSLGGTGTQSLAFVHPSFEELLRTRPVAYMTLDKPGITAPLGDPAALVMNDSEFEKHTQAHLIDCAEHALDYAWQNFQEPKIHLRGHSEGALISLYLYQRLLTERPSAAARISSMILSGLALEPFETILERQIADWTKTHGLGMRQAVQSCDWPSMKRYFGVSCAYLRDAYVRPSGRTMFETLAQAGVRLPIYVFQGSDDWHTPASFVHDLEAWNAREGKLDLKFVFYRGGHQGSEAAKAELEKLLGSLTAPAQPPAPG